MNYFVMLSAAKRRTRCEALLPSAMIPCCRRIKTAAGEKPRGGSI